MNGNLKCIGTSQHIKNKFGGSYEIEVKLELPIREEIDDCVGSLAREYQAPIDRSQVNQVLLSLNCINLHKEISEDGSDSAIHYELLKGKILVELLVEWILIEKYGEKLQVRRIFQNFE